MLDVIVNISTYETQIFDVDVYASKTHTNIGVTFKVNTDIYSISNLDVFMD